MPYYVDVGTGDSDLTWQAIGGIGYAFSWGEVLAAWRYIDYKFNGNKIQDINFNGPADRRRLPLVIAAAGARAPARDRSRGRPARICGAGTARRGRYNVAWTSC